MNATKQLALALVLAASAVSLAQGSSHASALGASQQASGVSVGGAEPIRFRPDNRGRESWAPRRGRGGPRHR